MILCSNYAPGIVPQMEAQKKGCQQILWLYGDDYKVTEAGTMNCFMFWENKQGEMELVTPDLDGTILPGVTRISILELVREWGELKVTERSFTMQELLEGLKENRVKEVFGAGTACVVCPVGQILFKGEMYEIPTMKDGAPLASRLLKTLNDIQYGRIKSPWAVDIEDLAEEEEGIRRKAR
ncbi:putative branched-chain-amino-acid aminotransferase, cytosolic-like [Apostichopus japonicus]|uniref:Branched-chain-amino-acid aminotransferase n=1 Tax=Stichopus japonicus TaxID=307972 RepID=A0A2G8L1L8_STIJA|nr:putative branched-chain-amino-acid aminotransferase, cytosolic-like [Apostichopus japonicus]